MEKRPFIDWDKYMAEQKVKDQRIKELEAANKAIILRAEAAEKDWQLAEERINGLEAQLEQHQWIKTSEKLPEELVETTPWRSEVVFVTDGKVWDVGFCRTRQRKWDLQVKHYMDITHWKPIILP